MFILTFQGINNVPQIYQMKRLQQIQVSLQREKIYDYLIVGCGVSGLQAADIISQQQNCSFLALQAQSEIGGRIQTTSIWEISGAAQVSWIKRNQKHFQMIKIQKGATWVQQGHLILKRICSDLQLKLNTQYSKGQSTYVLDFLSYTQQSLINHPLYGSEIKRVVKLIDDISKVYDKALYSNMVKPSLNGLALLRKYDSMTVLEFLMQEIPDSLSVVRDIFLNFFQHTECVACSQNSMHEVLTKNARSNDLSILKVFFQGTFEDDEESYLLEGGMEAIITAYKKRIQSNIKEPIANVIRTNHQVLTIDNRSSLYSEVVTENRETKRITHFKARKIICAVPLAVSKLIRFGRISEAKRTIFDNQIATNCTKSFVVCPYPFWRADSTGDGLFSQHHWVNICHDISPPDQSCGILVFFHSGVKLDRWESQFKSSTPAEEHEKKKIYMINLMCTMYSVTDPKLRAKYFGECLYYESSYQHNQFIRSGFQSNTRPKTFSALLDMNENLESFYRDEHGITFIGSEYSLRFASYIEGALRSARKKVYELIGKNDPLRLKQEEEKAVQ